MRFAEFIWTGSIEMTAVIRADVDRIHDKDFPLIFQIEFPHALPRGANHT
jgi:hypothetical protein